MTCLLDVISATLAGTLTFLFEEWWKRRNPKGSPDENGIHQG